MTRFALVTGGGSGIGRAAALALQGAGYGVAIAGRRIAQLDETVTQTSSGRAVSGQPAMLPIVTDVADPSAVDAMFAKIRESFGRLDVLFNNAGMSPPAVAIDELTHEQWTQVVDVNLTGSFLCAQGAVRLMKAQDPRGGRIINNGSVSAYAPRPNSIAYTSTKHAITGLTKCISLDGRAFDIACSQLDIGNAVTEMTEPMKDGVPQADGRIAVEPCMNVEHVANAVVHMAGLPLDANILFMTVMATNMPFVGRG